MANEDGTLQIIYNGEIYNHAEFRSHWWRAAMSTTRIAIPKRFFISMRNMARNVWTISVDVCVRDLGFQETRALHCARSSGCETAVFAQTNDGSLYSLPRLRPFSQLAQ